MAFVGNLNKPTVTKLNGGISLEWAEPTLSYPDDTATFIYIVARREVGRRYWNSMKWISNHQTMFLDRTIKENRNYEYYVYAACYGTENDRWFHIHKFSPIVSVNTTGMDVTPVLDLQAADAGDGVLEMILNQNTSESLDDIVLGVNSKTLGTIDDPTFPKTVRYFGLFGEQDVEGAGYIYSDGGYEYFNSNNVQLTVNHPTSLSAPQDLEAWVSAIGVVELRWKKEDFEPIWGYPYKKGVRYVAQINGVDGEIYVWDRKWLNNTIQDDGLCFTNLQNLDHNQELTVKIKLVLIDENGVTWLESPYSNAVTILAQNDIANEKPRVVLLETTKDSATIGFTREGTNIQPDRRFQKMRVYRDGNLLSTFPIVWKAPVYADKNVVQGQVYNYQIQLIDWYGRESAMSEPITVTPQDLPAGQEGRVGQLVSNGEREGSELTFVLDDNSETKWQSKYSGGYESGTYPQTDLRSQRPWIGYDFLTPQHVDKMRIVQGVSGKRANQIEIQVSNDSVNWYTVDMIHAYIQDDIQGNEPFQELTWYYNQGMAYEYSYRYSLYPFDRNKPIQARYWRAQAIPDPDVKGNDSDWYWEIESIRWLKFLNNVSVLSALSTEVDMTITPVLGEEVPPADMMKAFDFNPNTYWESEEKGEDVVAYHTYIEQRIEDPVEIYKIKIKQGSQDHHYGVHNLHVFASDDGIQFDYLGTYNVSDLFGSANDRAFLLTQPRKAAYWRFMAASPVSDVTGSTVNKTWRIRELQLSSESTINSLELGMLDDPQYGNPTENTGPTQPEDYSYQIDLDTESQVSFLRRRLDQDSAIQTEIQGILQDLRNHRIGVLEDIQAHLLQLSDMEIKKNGYVEHLIGLVQDVKLDDETQAYKFSPQGKAENFISTHLESWMDRSYLKCIRKSEEEEK